MSDNPFAEPEDDNRTVIRPTPGRRRPPSPAPADKASDEHPANRQAVNRPRRGHRQYLHRQRRIDRRRVALVATHGAVAQHGEPT